MDNRFQPRPAQQTIASYRNGTMGVSAVPGSGKTWTLSYLAAEIIANQSLQADQEVLIVTLVNSAVFNFSQRISQFLNANGLIPSLGYRVRTLHGLAHDIVKERPELAGLDNGFNIVDEREAIRIREDAVHSWLHDNPQTFDKYLISDLSDKKLEDLRRNQIPILLNQIALQFIRSAKNILLSPADIQDRINSSASTNPLANFGLEIYQNYQANLSYRGAVDFDDLITSAYQVLTLDSSLLSRLRYKWPYVLEDEAQDSSLLQQKILSLISTHKNQQNWVRVGDPNQAIYESFTTADPELLNSFIKTSQQSHSLPNSGRNTVDIINLANHLVEWCNSSHPVPQVRDALFPIKILPTPADDAQPNPPCQPDSIHLFNKPLTPDEELTLIASSVSKWLKDHPDSTAAILAPRNDRGKKMASLLRDQFHLDPVELLTSTLSTRKTIGSLVKIISYLIDPLSPKKLSESYKVFRRSLQHNADAWAGVEKIANHLHSLKTPELFTSPQTSSSLMDFLSDENSTLQEDLSEFHQLILKWHEAALLPMDQLILTIASDIFIEPSELNLAHQIANFERQLINIHPDWQLPILLDELRSLARNERRFLGAPEDIQFNPNDHRGKVVITTAHKAKGLEWDRVYLISANNYNFPSGAPNDQYISEKWFIRDNLNLPEEALSLLYLLSNNQVDDYLEGNASSMARFDYIRERLRLFYVSITRARKELVITWNNGRKGSFGPALAFQALHDFHKSLHEDN